MLQSRRTGMLPGPCNKSWSRRNSPPGLQTIQKDKEGQVTLCSSLWKWTFCWPHSSPENERRESTTNTSKFISWNLTFSMRKNLINVTISSDFSTRAQKQTTSMAIRPSIGVLDFISFSLSLKTFLQFSNQFVEEKELKNFHRKKSCSSLLSAAASASLGSHAVVRETPSYIKDSKKLHWRKSFSDGTLKACDEESSNHRNGFCTRAPSKGRRVRKFISMVPIISIIFFLMTGNFLCDTGKEWSEHWNTNVTSAWVVVWTGNGCAPRRFQTTRARCLHIDWFKMLMITWPSA